MQSNNFWGTPRPAGVRWGLVVRLVLAVLATVASIALAWTLLSPHRNAHAANIVNAPTTNLPWGVALDNGGHIFVAEPNCQLFPNCLPAKTGIIGQYDTTNPTKSGTEVDYVEPANNTPPFSSPAFLVWDSKTKSIWFTEPSTAAIGQLIPGTTPIWHNYSTGTTATSIPRDLTLDKNDNIWFTDSKANSISFFNTTSHVVTANALLNPNSDPWGILTDKNGHIWFGENNFALLGELVPPATAGKATPTEHAITTGTVSHMLALDSAGKIWYSEAGALGIGKFDPTTGKVVKDYSVAASICSPAPPCSSLVAGIAIDSHGRVLWDDQQFNHVGFLNPGNSNVAAVTVGAFPFDGLVVDSKNNIWVTENTNSVLDEIPPSAVGGGTPTPTNTPSGSPTATSSVTPSPTGSVTPAPSPSPTQPSGGNVPVNKTWYFAEGKVGAGFTEYITIENPDINNTCAVNITYLLGNGAPAGSQPITESVNISTSTRFTEFVNHDLSAAGLLPTPASSVEVSTIVQVDPHDTACNGVVAERPIYFTNFQGVNSGTDVVGATQLDKAFYFADMPTIAGYHSYITILNPPGGQSANIAATYYQGGQPISSTPQTLVVAAGTRGTIIPPASNAHMSAYITSDQPVMIERPSYFSNIPAGNAGVVSGSGSVIGAPSPASNWLFAEGYTGSGFQEMLVLANFDPTTDVTATVTLEYENGHTQILPSLIVPHQDVKAYDINALSAQALGTCDTTPCQVTNNVSLEVSTSSSTPIVAEREMFFHYNNGHDLSAIGGTDATGIAASQSAYTFAEGYTNAGYNEWLTLQNPTANPETISVMLVNTLGQHVTEQYTVAAKSRFTVNITSLVAANLAPPGSPFTNFEVSMSIQSDGGPFVAERPMYWNTYSNNNPNGTQGGSDVFGYIGG